MIYENELNQINIHNHERSKCIGKCYECEPMARGISIQQCVLCTSLGEEDTEALVAECCTDSHRRCLRVYAIVSQQRREFMRNRKFRVRKKGGLNGNATSSS